MTVDTVQQARVGGERGFDVTFRRVGAVCILAMRGGLDSASVAVLESEFDRLWRTPCRRVVLDLDALGALDETGARVLTGLHHYLEARGGTMTVIGANPWVADVLATTPLLPPSGASAS